VIPSFGGSDAQVAAKVLQLQGIRPALLRKVDRRLSAAEIRTKPADFILAVGLGHGVLHEGLLGTLV